MYACMPCDLITLFIITLYQTTSAEKIALHSSECNRTSCSRGAMLWLLWSLCLPSCRHAWQMHNVCTLHTHPAAAFTLNNSGMCPSITIALHSIAQTSDKTQFSASSASKSGLAVCLHPAAATFASEVQPPYSIQLPQHYFVVVQERKAICQALSREVARMHRQTAFKADLSARQRQSWDDAFAQVTIEHTCRVPLAVVMLSAPHTWAHKPAVRLSRLSKP